MSRPIYPHDVQDVVRAMMYVDAADRAAQAQEILQRAFSAAQYRVAHGAPHPIYGSGTLSAAARSYRLAPLPAAYDKAYMRCLRQFLEIILDGDPRHFA